jgi:hypothetical protein
VLERTAELKWKRSKGDWVKSDLPNTISLRFDDVSRFELRPRDPEVPYTGDDCLSSFGYLTDEDWCDGIFWIGYFNSDHFNIYKVLFIYMVIVRLPNLVRIKGLDQTPRR